MMVRLRGGLVLGCFVIGLAACGSKTPTTPTPPPVVITPTIATPAPRAPIAGLQLDTLKPTLSVTNAVVAGNVGTVTYEFEVSEVDSFPVGTRTSSEKSIQQGGDGATNWVPPSDLIANRTYFWHARAAGASVANPTDWSKTETFKTLTRGFVIPGQEVYDPLTDGRTVGTQVGGHFEAGQGWKADNDSNGIFYDFGACTSCTVEFDVTNFGKAAGAPALKDYKWITMGDAGSFGGPPGFTSHPWKMHLEQRGDEGGTGMKLIWRNGDAGDGNPGDHEHRNNTTVDWQSNVVYHFTLRWTPSNYSVTVGTVGTDGQVTGNRTWFEGSFGGRAYQPNSLRISLGCYPRSESMAGAIWRHVRIVKN